MTIVDAGLNRLRDLLDADFFEGAVGTDATAEDASDTALGSEVAGTNKAVTTTTSDKQVTVDYNLPSTDGNGNTLREFGIMVDSTNDILFSRHVMSSLSKSSTEEFQFTVIYKLI